MDGMENRKRVRIITRFVVACMLNEKVTRLIKAICYGCQIDHPCEDEHTCMFADPCMNVCTKIFVKRYIDKIIEIIRLTVKYAGIVLLNIFPRNMIYEYF